MQVEASPLTLRVSSLCADVQVNRGLWELEVPGRHLFFLDLTQIFCVRFHHDQYPPQFMWAFERYKVLMMD